MRRASPSSPAPAKTIRCAVYTRKSTSEGLDSDFSSLDAQRESAQAFILSQKAQGWTAVAASYDDGGFTGGNMDRPALQRLIADIQAGLIDVVVVYKIDRLSRSLRDFHRLIDVFERHNASFVSVTQSFNSATPMGKLTLNILMSFSEFERELISERTRDKIAAARRKGRWSGGMPVLGYDVDDRGKLIINDAEAVMVRGIFEIYARLQSITGVLKELQKRGWKSKAWTTRKGTPRGGSPFDKNTLYRLLTSVTYRGQVQYKDETHPGEHEDIVPEGLWQKVQTILARNRRAAGAASRNKYDALLRGLLHCTACNCAMTHAHTAKGSRRYRYYICVSAQRHGWHTCPTKSVPAGQIEAFVIDQIRHIGNDPKIIFETVRQAQQQLKASVEALDAEMIILQKQNKSLLGQIQKAATKGDTSKVSDLQERVKVIEERLASLKADRAKRAQEQVDQGQLASALARFDPVWQALTPREQARLIELLIARVDFDGRGGNVNITFRAIGIQTLNNHPTIMEAA